MIGMRIRMIRVGRRCMFVFLEQRKGLIPGEEVHISVKRAFFCNLGPRMCFSRDWSVTGKRRALH